MKPKESPPLNWGGSWLALRLALLLSCIALGCSQSTVAGSNSKVATGNSYSTTFPLAQNPVSESGMWVNGKSLGIDWSNVATLSGLAYGTQSGKNGYDDAIALLTGSWGANQMAEATVHSVNQNDAVYEEVELRLRSSVSPDIAKGYEINFRCSKTADAYAAIVRWNGALGDFTPLIQGTGASYGVADGDVVKATVIGNVITAYINGVQVLQATDSTFASGNPGMGFFLDGSAVNTDYGFSTFSASDEI